MKIKTREALQSVKTFDRGADKIAHKTKDGASSINKSAEETQNSSDQTENEYATHEVEVRERAIIRGTVSGANRIGKWGVRETVKNIYKWRKRRKAEKLEVNPKQLKSPDRPMLKEGTKNGAKTTKKGGKKVAETFKKAGEKIKGTRKTIKTATKATKNTARATKATTRATKAAARTAKAIAKGSIKLAQLAKKAIMAAIKAAKIAIKAIIAAVKAIIAAVKALIAAIAAGGWIVVVVIIVIVLVAMLAGSIYGIFVPAEDNEINVYDVMYELDSEYAKKEADLIADSVFDTITYKGNTAKWDEVVGVYAVKLNLDSEDPQDVVIFDEAKADELRSIYRKMNTVRVETEEIQKEIIKQITDSDGNVKEVTETVTLINLIVIRESMSYLDAADEYNFNEEQREMLTELLDEKNAELWQGLLTPKN